MESIGKWSGMEWQRDYERLANTLQLPRATHHWFHCLGREAEEKGTKAACGTILVHHGGNSNAMAMTVVIMTMTMMMKPVDQIRQKK